jgi:uncharacterized protein (DUF1015 family)
LPESAGEAGRLYREWLARGILEHDDEPAFWLAAEEFVGPDGIARTRLGLVVSVAATPYGEAGVLPHERTDPHIRAERQSLLRELRVQPEPVLLLADTSLTLVAPQRPPDLEVDGSRLWRMTEDGLDGLNDAQLLVADGHHRYESTVALGAELDASVRIMALVVATNDAGLVVFPTHRTFSNRPDLASGTDDKPCATLDEALARLDGLSRERSAAVRYRRGSVGILLGARGELDVELVDRHGLDGIRYTPQLEEAVSAVDAGAADVAFLLRAPRVEDVFETARHGERMPPKSTYFFPKPLSGLLFHPVTP